jgi:hypothetical protein
VLTAIIAAPVTAAEAMMISVSITACTPKARVPVIRRTPVTDAEPSTGTAKPHAEAETPAGVRVVPHTETVGHRSRVIIVAVPGSVVVAGAVEDTPAINIGTGIPWGVTYMHDARRVIINVDIFDIVDR